MGRAGRIAYTVARWQQPLRRAIDEFELQLLHAHFGVEGVYSRAAAERAGVPHVVTLHGFDVSYSEEYLRRSRRPAWLWYARERSALLRSESTFVCVSEHVRAQAVALGLDPAQAVVIPTGVDTKALVPSPPPEGCRIVHVARLVEKKGTAVLLEAVDILRRSGVDADLEIIGDGPLRGELEATVGRLGLEDRVRFHGARDHAFVLDAIRRSRVLCQPSLTAVSGDTEGLGQAILEAGALGRPVVGSAHGGITEAVDDGVSGILVPEGDAEALAEALRRVLLEPGTADELGSAGARLVRTRFDLGEQASRLADVYDGLRSATARAPDSRNARDLRRDAGGAR